MGSETIKPLGRPAKLKSAHIEYLVSQETLNQQAGLSLAERAVLFHRQFPELKVSHSTIARVYKLNGVKFKMIQRVKPKASMSAERLSETLLTMKSHYQRAVREGALVLFVDEAVFSPNTMLLRSWAATNESIEVQDLRKRLKTEAIIAAISQERGLESYMIRERSFN